MFTSSIYKETITRLKFISKIQEGEKINTKHYLAIVNNDWLNSVLRTFYNFESRNHTVQFVNDTINTAFQLLDQMKVSLKIEDKINIDEMNIMTNMFKDLTNSIVGIHNLKKTYKTDKIIVCQLETIIENIELFLHMHNIDIKVHNPIDSD